MKKVLFVDDNDDYLEILELVLGKKYITKSCKEVRCVLQVITEFAPDLVLIDHFLGLHTSTEIFSILTSGVTGKPIPAILISGIEDIALRAAELGAVGFISKPSSVEHIRNYIDDFFENHL